MPQVRDEFSDAALEVAGFGARVHAAGYMTAARPGFIRLTGIALLAAVWAILYAPFAVYGKGNAKKEEKPT